MKPVPYTASEETSRTRPWLSLNPLFARVFTQLLLEHRYGKLSSNAWLGWMFPAKISPSCDDEVAVPRGSLSGLNGYARAPVAGRQRAGIVPTGPG